MTEWFHRNEEKHKETHGWLYNERIPGSDVKAITNTVEGVSIYIHCNHS